MDKNMTSNVTPNKNSTIISERIKFYADTDLQRNKLFCYKISSIFSLKDALWRFWDKGWHIRSAWYEKIEETINQDTGEVTKKEIIENTLIDLKAQEKKYVDHKILELRKG